MSPASFKAAHSAGADAGNRNVRGLTPWRLSKIAHFESEVVPTLRCPALQVGSLRSGNTSKIECEAARTESDYSKRMDASHSEDGKKKHRSAGRASFGSALGRSFGSILPGNIAKTHAKTSHPWPTPSRVTDNNRRYLRSSDNEARPARAATPPRSRQ
jgi:hypothetical protein